jgi:hypothetical protein
MGAFTASTNGVLFVSGQVVGSVGPLSNEV